MNNKFRQRSHELEWMDLAPLTPTDALQVLRNLETINAWLGGVGTTLAHFKGFSRTWAPGATIRILDWGTGGADIPRAIVRWARRSGYDIRIVGVDQDPVTVDYAQTACADFPEIEIQCVEAGVFTAEDGSFDYCMSSLTLHHLTDDAIVAVLRTSDRLARRGIVMNDLKRSPQAWGWIWLLSRLAGWHAMVQHDGPLSVRRAFTAAELASYARQAGLLYLKPVSHWPYRFALAGEKS